MPVVNVPPMMKTIIGDLDKRIRKLEQSPDKRAYGEFYDTTVQSASVTTSAFTVNINTTAESNYISLASNTITVQRTGVYLVVISAQFYNTAAGDLDAELWPVLNGTDVVWSNSRLSVPGKHGSTNGHTLGTINYIFSMNANNTLFFRWRVEGTTVGILSETGLTTPTRPNIPGVLVTINEIAW